MCSSDLAVGGSGVSAMTSMALATDASYVLDECAKLVTFCEEVLIKRYGDLTSVGEIHGVLNQRIMELEVEIEAIKRGVSDDDIPDDEDDAIDEKEEIGSGYWDVSIGNERYFPLGSGPFFPENEVEYSRLYQRVLTTDRKSVV